MSKIHLHIEHLSLPGYTPAERRAFVAALERELANSGVAGNSGLSRVAHQEAVRVSATDLRPQAVAQKAVAGLNLGGKIGGRR